MKKDYWALLLGASSGFGEATSLELARSGFNICGVHLDTGAAKQNAERIENEIREMGCLTEFFNLNAADAGNRATVIERMTAYLPRNGEPFVKVLLHSLAFGTLLPYIAETPKGAISQKQMDMTLDVMAHSLVYWTQDLVSSGLMGEGSRVFAMTSSGSARVIKAYGAVSAAKAALESHIRQIAFELAPLGITANAIQAGATDTPALRRIPGGPELYERAKALNPSGRATTTADVAKAIAALADERLGWMTGNVIRIDGGEDITG